MGNALILIALWPIVHFDFLLRRFRLRPDRMHWADRIAINHGSLSSDWFYG